jgi:fluoride exporter
MVSVGGMLGVGAREVLVAALPVHDGPSMAVFVANVTGAFAIGGLLELVSRSRRDAGLRRGVRLFFGTGILGGYTTYSALSLDSATLLASGNTIAGVAYPLVSVLVGFLAAWGGVAVGGRLHTARNPDLGRVSR